MGLKYIDFQFIFFYKTDYSTVNFCVVCFVSRFPYKNSQESPRVLLVTVRYFCRDKPVSG